MEVLRYMSLCLIGLVATLAAAQESPSSNLIQLQVEKYKLANGLTVLIHEDHSAPLLSYHTWFRVGSKDEETGLTGIAHLFEHMMFKGAKRYTGNQFDEVLQAKGITNNAFTTQDYTGYFESGPAEHLEIIMDIESDRMTNLVIDSAGLQSEREVVKEERRYRVENSPMGMLYERIFEVVFKSSPYRWPVIGYMKDLGNVNVENATRFYRTFYAPNNAVVVIAGDVKVSEAKALIEKYYGAIQSQQVPVRALASEIPQKNFRSDFITSDVKSPLVSLSYLAPKAGSDDAFALDLLGNILATGQASRLYRRLVHRDQSTMSVSAWNWSGQLDGLFSVVAELKPGVNPIEVEESMRKEIYRPQVLPVTQDELKAAKNQTIMSYVDGLKTINGKARALAQAEVIYGDYTRLFAELDKYQAVRIDDIKRVASTYLNKTKSSLVILRPKEKKTASLRSEP